VIKIRSANATPHIQRKTNAQNNTNIFFIIDLSLENSSPHYLGIFRPKFFLT
jgi:hypothetical protein